MHPRQTKQTDKTDEQTNRQTNRQTDKTDRQTDRQTDRHRHRPSCLYAWAGSNDQAPHLHPQAAQTHQDGVQQPTPPTVQAQLKGVGKGQQQEVAVLHQVEALREGKGGSNTVLSLGSLAHATVGCRHTRKSHNPHQSPTPARPSHHITSPASGSCPALGGSQQRRRGVSGARRQKTPGPRSRRGRGPPTPPPPHTATCPTKQWSAPQGQGKMQLHKGGEEARITITA